MREKILLNGKIAELKGALDDAVNAKEVFAGEIKNEESKFKNLFQTIKEESSPVKGGGGRDPFVAATQSSKHMQKLGLSNASSHRSSSRI